MEFPVGSLPFVPSSPVVGSPLTASESYNASGMRFFSRYRKPSINRTHGQDRGLEHLDSSLHARVKCLFGLLNLSCQIVVGRIKVDKRLNKRLSFTLLKFLLFHSSLQQPVPIVP